MFLGWQLLYLYFECNYLFLKYLSIQNQILTRFQWTQSMKFWFTKLHKDKFSSLAGLRWNALITSWIGRNIKNIVHSSNPQKLYASVGVVDFCLLCMRIHFKLIQNYNIVINHQYAVRRIYRPCQKSTLTKTHINKWPQKKTIQG